MCVCMFSYAITKDRQRVANPLRAVKEGMSDRQSAERETKGRERERETKQHKLLHILQFRHDVAFCP